MNRKGVTPVIATSLLIGIAISTVLTASVFLNNNIDTIREGFTDDLNDEQIQEEAELSVEFGYDRSGWLFLDVRNTGETGLPLKNDQGDDRLEVYVDGRPQTDWSMVNERDLLARGSKLTINSSVTFPGSGSRKEVEVIGPFETSSAIICFNDGSSTSC